MGEFVTLILNYDPRSVSNIQLLRSEPMLPIYWIGAFLTFLLNLNEFR